MARPKKQSIEYFTHPVKTGKTIEMLENIFGITGYAFWYKLLEIIGDTPGFAYDCSDDYDWIYIQAKTKTDEETAAKIMSVLVRLGEVDKELWEQNRIIWVQSFVDSLADLYERRKSELPHRPNCKTVNAAETGVFRTETGVFRTETRINNENSDNNPQSKVKYSIVKKRKEKENTLPTDVGRVKENPAGFSPTDTASDDKDVSLPAAPAAAPPKADNGKPAKPKPPREPAFRPPTLEQVRARCREMNYTNVNPEKFFDFYESKGWMVGKNKMKKWQCALANWARDGDYPPGGRAAHAAGRSAAQPPGDVLGMWERLKRNQNGAEIQQS